MHCSIIEHLMETDRNVVFKGCAQSKYVNVFFSVCCDHGQLVHSSKIKLYVVTAKLFNEHRETRAFSLHCVLKTML